MKTFLALLISCLTLSAATTYPVLTDSTNRLFPGGVTNVFFLNSNVVTTGTMRATGSVTLTNSGNVFAGDGSGLTGISEGVPTLNGSATNLSVYSSGTTNRPLRVYGTNGTTEVYVTKDGVLTVPSGLYYAPSLVIGTAGSGFAQYSAGSSGIICWLNNGIGPIFQDEGIGVNQHDFVWFTGGDDPQYSTRDVALKRTSAGLLEVNSGTLAAYRDFVARSLYATNLYATNLIINGGSQVTKIISATATLNFDLTALTVEDLTITVTGAADGDVVTLGVPNGSVTTSVQYSAWVSAADTVTVRARTSAVGENPASGTFRATVIKH